MLAISFGFLAGPLRAQFVYVTNLDGTVSGYSMDRKTGALTPLSVPIFTAGSNPDSIAVDPTGKFVYVANFSSDSVSGYSIDQATGVLTPLSAPTFPGGSGPQSVAADPTGKFVYVANTDYSNTISAYVINESSGALKKVNGSPFRASNPLYVAVDPTGKFACVTSNDFYATIDAYKIESSGALKLVNGASSVSFARGPTEGVAFDPKGNFVYVVSASPFENDVFAFRVESSGALGYVAGSPFPAGANPTGIATL